MGRLTVRQRAAALARGLRSGRVKTMPPIPAEETRARKNEVRACTASACAKRVSDAPPQAAELQRRWRIATLLDHHDGYDDELISSTRNDALRRAGLPILGDTCFINAALQALARPLLSSRFDLETGTLAAQAADVALQAVRGLLADTLASGGQWHSSSRALNQPYALSTPAPAPPRRHVFDRA